MYNFKTIVLGTDKDKLMPISDHIREEYNDDVFMTFIRVEFEEYLTKQQPDILLIDISTQLSSAEKKNITESVKIVKEKYPECVLMAFGGKKSTLKDKEFQEAVDLFSGKTIQKISKDYEAIRSRVILKGNKMIVVLTGFFAPYLVGNYKQPGFDRLLTETYSREENLEILNQLKRNFLLFKPLLQEHNQELLENALEVYPERDLTREEIEQIKEAFFFQFTSLTAMKNFIDRRRYYAEKDVIKDIWETTISYAREVENTIIFGCHKLGNTVKLKVTVPAEYDLKKISPRSKYYKTIQKIQPYGTMTIKSGDQTVYIGSGEPEAELDAVDKLVFSLHFRVVVPTRGRRGLKRR